MDGGIGFGRYLLPKPPPLHPGKKRTQNSDYDKQSYQNKPNFVPAGRKMCYRPKLKPEKEIEQKCVEKERCDRLDRNQVGGFNPHCFV